MTKVASAGQGPKLVGELYQIANFVMTLVIDAAAVAAFMGSAKASELRALAKKWPPEETGPLKVGSVKALCVELGSLTGGAGRVYVFRSGDCIVLLEGPNREESMSEGVLRFVAAPLGPRRKRLGDFSFGDVVALAPSPDIFGETTRVRAQIARARAKGAATLLDDEDLPVLFLSLAAGTTYRASIDRVGRGSSKMARLVLRPNASR